MDLRPEEVKNKGGLEASEKWETPDAVFCILPVHNRLDKQLCYIFHSVQMYGINGYSNVSLMVVSVGIMSVSWLCPRGTIMSV